MVDIRNCGLMAAIELEPRAGQPGKRAYEVFVKAFEAGVLIRVTGDTIALSPPLIVEKAQIDRILECISTDAALGGLKRHEREKTKMNYGGFWIRFLAYIVDSLIVTIGFLGDRDAPVGDGARADQQRAHPPGDGRAVLRASCSPRRARRPSARRSCGLKVGGPEGERIGLGRAARRAKWPRSSPSMTFLIGFIIAGFTRRKQALHDFIASTVVVRAEKGQVVAALAVALVALMAPFVVVFMFGAGLVAGMLGGFAGAMLTFPEIAMQAPKPAAPPVPKPAAPVAKPVTVAATAPAPQAPEPPKPAPAAKPVRNPGGGNARGNPGRSPRGRRASPRAAEARSRAKGAGEARSAPNLPRKSQPEAAKDEGAPRMAPRRPPNRCPGPTAPPMAPPSPTFNDLATAVIYRDA